MQRHTEYLVSRQCATVVTNSWSPPWGMVSQWQVQAPAAAVPENQKHQASVCYGSFGIRG